MSANYLIPRTILFFDIETVSCKNNFDELSDKMQHFWSKKMNLLLQNSKNIEVDQNINDYYEQKAAIYAEFGKIVCISVGMLSNYEDKHLTFKIKSFAHEDEKQLLLDFCQMLNSALKTYPTLFLCGHNIREFDIPYICRRLLINRLETPNHINLQNKPPWKTEYILDTLALWKFGDYKNFASLDLLCALFDIPSPKTDLDGSQVSQCYYKDKDLAKIVNYCENDIRALIQVFYCLSNIYDVRYTFFS